MVLSVLNSYLDRLRDGLFPITILGFETLVGQNTAVNLHRNQELFRAMDGEFRARGDTTFFMSNPLGPLTTRELLDRTIRIYGQHIFLFIGISALPYLCWVVINFCWLAGYPSFDNLLANAVIDGAIWVRRHLPFIPQVVVKWSFAILTMICATLYGIVPLLLKVLAGAIVTAATSIGISDFYLNRQTTVMGCFSRLKGRVGKVIYACAALCVTTGAGLILLIIPGILGV